MASDYPDPDTLIPSQVLNVNLKLHKFHLYTLEKAHRLSTLPIPLASELYKNPVDPVTVLPVEVMAMILEYMPDMKSLVTLERVSKKWTQMLGAVCRPAWVVGRWGVGVDWMRKEEAEGEGWERFRNEGMYLLI